MFSIYNYTTILIAAGNIHCALRLIVFCSTIYNCKCAYLSFKNSTPPQLTSAQWSFFHLWQLKKEETESVLLTPLHILQMRRAFIAAFTNEKHRMTIKKSLFRNWPLIPKFFIVHLSLYNVKPKAQSERCAPFCAFGH